MRTLIPLVTALALAVCADPPTKPADPGGERPTVSAVSVSSPFGPIVPVGWEVTLDAEARSAQGATLQTDITWSSADPAVASVTSSGTVSGVAAGATVITAETGNVRGTIALTVADADLTALADLLSDPLAERLIAALEPATGDAVRLPPALALRAPVNRGSLYASRAGNLETLDSLPSQARYLSGWR